MPSKRGCLRTKMWIIMRISFFLLIAALHVSAKGHTQRITLVKDRISIKEALNEINKQAGYSFIGGQALLENAPLISLSLKEASITEAMDQCLKGLPYHYVIEGLIITIRPKAPPPLVLQPADTSLQPHPQMDIHGRVRDSLGTPLAGASVTIKGTNKGTKTNAKGEFDMKDVRSDMILVISYTGYTSKEVSLSNGASQAYIVLQRSQDILDATVIQAYGTTSRRYNVGSISTVDAATIEKQPVTNVLLALEGQVPGLAVNAMSGVPGSSTLIQVRGQNTLKTPLQQYRPYDQPLFIIDGVPFAPQNTNLNQLSSLANANSIIAGGIQQAGGISPFNGLNPADIETISILKDADATSIYGTQGSNGVILITTKKGKPGKTNLNLSANTGFNSSISKLKLMNTQQYLQFRKDAFAADGVTPSSDPNNYSAFAPDVTIFDSTKYTDLQKVIYGKTSNNTDVHASLSGGTTNNTFLFSAGYTRSDFNYPGNYADQRLTLHSNTHHASNDSRLSFDFGVDYGYDENNSSAAGGGQRILNPPNTPDLLDSAGNLNWSYKHIDLNQYQFYAYLKKPVLLQSYNLNTTAHLSYRLMRGLSISAIMGYSRNTSNERSANPAAAQDPTYISVTANFANNNFQTINIEPQVDYNVTIGKGSLTALLGGTYKKNTNTSNITTGYNYNNDNFLQSIDGAGTVYGSDNYDIYKYAAGFARLKYVYDQKYILSLTGRRDGSSNFGPGRQFGDFGSVGAGWIFSEEEGFKKVLRIISYAKLSGSYGTSGSDGGTAYSFQPYWKAAPSAVALPGIVTNATVFPNIANNLYNPNYSWANKKSLNLSLDLGFFQDRLLLNTTFYRDRETNQLAGYPLPAQVGMSQVLENIPSTVQNQGWEFTLTSTNIRNKAFSWTTNFNITFNRNKLVAFTNLENSSYSSTYVIGKPTSVVWGYQFKGLNSNTGLFEYYTHDGKVTNSPNYNSIAMGGDYMPIADREVKYMGGMANTFTYKQFTLYVFFQFSSQTAPNWLATVYGQYLPATSSNNLPVQALDYWKQPGDHTTLQKLTSAYGTDAYTAASYFGQSSGAYGDDTYVRLKTVSLSYSLPENVVKKWHMHDCRIYINAQNLLTITNYKVSDPEQFSDYSTFPLQRIVACGLSFNF